jgi:electron-transferring-flavoprotein dehydrogenase
MPNWPMPPLMNNHGNYIVSMGNVCRWMAEQAEELGVEIFPGMSCSELVYGEDGEVKGVVAGEFGLEPRRHARGRPTSRGWSCTASTCSSAEGVRGSLAKEVIAKYDLSRACEPQKYGLGMKEIWEIDPEKHREGTVTHTMGWPLGKNAGGGSFIYHLENNQVYVGLRGASELREPAPVPYMEFQRFKHHPMVAELLKGGKRVAYGARAISEGGWQSMPKAGGAGRRAAGLLGGAWSTCRGSRATTTRCCRASRGRGRGGDRRPARGDELEAYETELREGARSAEGPQAGAQRQAALVEATGLMAG